MIDWNQARQFWRDGLDTYDIAKFFGVPESDIYNGLNRRSTAYAVSSAASQGMQERGGSQADVSGGAAPIDRRRPLRIVATGRP